MGLASPMHPTRRHRRSRWSLGNPWTTRTSFVRDSFCYPVCQRRSLEIAFTWLSSPRRLPVQRWNERPRIMPRTAALLTRGALLSQGPARLDPLSEYCMTSTRPTYPECLSPVKTHRSKTDGRSERVDATSSDPAQLHVTLPNSRKHAFQRTRRENLATLETTALPG